MTITQNYLFDLSATQPKSTGGFHGGGKYAKIVFLELLKYIKTEKLYVLYDSSQFIESILIQKCYEYKIEKLDISKYSLQKIIVEKKINIFYTAVPSYYIKEKLPVNCRFFCTIHDLREIELVSDRFEYKYTKGLKNNLKFLIKYFLPRIYINHQINKYNHFLKNNSSNFITVTNYSKYSLLMVFPFLKKDDIKVLYSPLLKEDKNIITNLKNESYFLLVSGDRWVKNNYRAIIALDGLFSKGFLSNFKVVLTGCTKKNIYIKDIKNKDNFIFLDYVAEEKLESLYANCFAFLYPTLNEGFGYPPLEAMKYKKPVLSSASSSLLELLEDSVLYFNPYMIMEIQNKILQLLDNNIYEKYSQLGYERYVKVSKKQKEDLIKIVNFILHKSN